MKKAHVLKRFTAIALVFALFLSFASIKSLALEEDSDITDQKIENFIKENLLTNSFKQADLIHYILYQYEKGSIILEITEIKILENTLTISGWVKLPNGNLVENRTEINVSGMHRYDYSWDLIHEFLSQYESDSKLLEITKIKLDERPAITIEGDIELPDGAIHTGGMTLFL